MLTGRVYNNIYTYIYKAQAAQLFTQSWRENRWIHTFTKNMIAI